MHALRLPSSRIVSRIRAFFTALFVLSLTAGCAQQPATVTGFGSTGAGATPWALPTSTVQWNDYACDLIARYAVGQYGAMRTLAYLNLAINNAIVTARSRGLEADGAAAGAAATTLTYFFPKEEQAIGARLDREVAALGAGPRARFAPAVDVGRNVATEVVALAKADRSDRAWTGTVPVGADKWSSRAQPPQPPVGAHFGQVRTFFLTTGADVRAPPPPAYDSPAFRATLREVRTVSDMRTNEQVRIAQYWENLSGSFAAGAWNAVARSAIASHNLDEAASARVLALMHMVAVDAVVACHDSKYTYWVPRPTQADPEIRLAIGVPNFPSYPSNHACISGAVGLVMDAMFADQRGMYFAMGKQAGESRIYAGIHYRIDLDSGYEIARKVSARALEVGVPTDRPFVPHGR
jgi:hypothetical protein